MSRRKYVTVMSRGVAADQNRVEKYVGIKPRPFVLHRQRSGCCERSGKTVISTWIGLI